MNLRALDLNLLVVFDALITERHVTRAAHRVAMSQPAVSNALARLRYVFKDELFIRRAGIMEPTPRALELGDAVRQILRQTERLLTTDVGFEPRTSTRAFTARMSDLIGYLALPRIAAQLRERAPSMSMTVLHMAPDRTLKALEDDQLDFALSMELKHLRSIRSEALFQDRMCCVMRADHPLAGTALTLKKFMAARHLRVSMSPTDTRFVDSILADRGLQREVHLNVPHWLLIPPVLGATDLIAVVSSKLAARFAAEGIVARPLPFKSEGFSWRIYWHRRYEKSPAHAWVRETILAACKDL
jgi:DNA-binding transcriptional LysR family regulator